MDGVLSAARETMPVGGASEAESEVFALPVGKSTTAKAGDWELALLSAGVEGVDSLDSGVWGVLADRP